VASIAAKCVSLLVSNPIILQVDDLRTYFHGKTTTKAVDGLSFRLVEGETLGIVGESGSGKSVTSLSIMRLLDPNAKIVSGKILFGDVNLVQTPESEMRKIRGASISMIFQEPMTALNPVFTVGAQIEEAIRIHENVGRKESRNRCLQLLDEVGIPDPSDRANYYPHQLSGGQKQRVMIAMALSCDPTVLIADEPTTALDVTIQKQILDLLRGLREKRGMSIIFITHDLGVIAEIADRVLVMYRGQVVESGDVLQIFESPQHPYTKGLLACRPKLSGTFNRLPTISDFMETQVDQAGEILIREKTPSYSDRHSETNQPPQQLSTQDPLLRVRDLRVHFAVRAGMFSKRTDAVKAVDGINLDVFPGQTLGLVGESGCGKTTTGRAILRLIEPTSGQVKFDGVDMAQLSPSQLRKLRRRVQIVFQDPYGSLNPRQTIESAITQPMLIQGIGSSRNDRQDRAASLLDEVGMQADYLTRYPHQFSGGQRQRIGIARALAVEPDFIICDESVSALDVSVQAQVLNLLKDLQQRRGLTYVFISHDLSVVRFMADDIAVMQAGKIVEFGSTKQIYTSPSQNYTQKLLAATPDDDLESIRRRLKSSAHPKN